MKFVHVTETPSTMDCARDRLTHVDTEVFVVADRQTAGRGRRGSPWLSPVGGLYASYAGRVPAAAQFAGLSLAAGVMLIEALGLESLKVGLKWPNDVVHVPTAKKLSGILVESSLGADACITICIGVGVNITPVLQAAAAVDDSTYQATSLSEVGYPITSQTRDTIAEKLSVAIPALVQTVTKHGFQAYYDRWLNYSAHKNPITVDQGGAFITGKYHGIDGDGSLLIHDGNMIQKVVAGHLLSW